MGIIPGVIASANKTSVPSKKLSLLITSNNNKVYETDTLDAMLTYLASYSITVPVTLQFNTSDTHVVTSTPTFNFSNSGNLFTVKAKSGFIPIIDANNALSSAVTVGMSNFVWDGVNIVNADITNSAGCLIRVNSNTTNITVKNTKFKRGYCAMRATGTIDNSGNNTSIVDGLTIRDCTIEDVIDGSFRLGNGDTFNLAASTNFGVRTASYYDMKNVTIENITLIDNFNKGVITGQTKGFMGMILTKRILGLTIKNITCNNTSDSIVLVENSGTVVIDRVTCNNFGFAGTSNTQGIYITDTDDVTLTNVFVKPNADGVGKLITGFNNVRNLKTYFNTFAYVNSNDVPFYGAKMALVRLLGNLFKSGGGSKPCEIAFTGDNGYTPSIAQDLLEEDYNVFCSDGGYNTNLQLYSNTYGVFDVEVQTNSTGSKINPSTYRSTYNLGVNSIFTTDTNLLFSTRTNPDSSTSYAMYITDGLQGRNAVPSIQKAVSLDAFGFTRTFPSDVGACDRDAVVLA